jgi:hypothetical protein
MNLVNLSTALHRVAKIVGNDAWLQAPNTLGRSGWTGFYGGLMGLNDELMEIQSPRILCNYGLPYW